MTHMFSVVQQIQSPEQLPKNYALLKIVQKTKVSLSSLMRE